MGGNPLLLEGAKVDHKAAIASVDNTDGVVCYTEVGSTNAQEFGKCITILAVPGPTTTSTPHTTSETSLSETETSETETSSTVTTSSLTSSTQSSSTTVTTTPHTTTVSSTTTATETATTATTQTTVALDSGVSRTADVALGASSLWLALVALG